MLPVVDPDDPRTDMGEIAIHAPHAAHEEIKPLLEEFSRLFLDKSILKFMVINF